MLNPTISSDVSLPPYRDFAFVFDLGGVLLDWNPRHLYRKLFAGDLDAMERFLTEVGFYTWNLEQDKGRPMALAVKELCHQFPHHADLIKAYDERWEETLAGAIQPSVAILAELKNAGYPLFALSNWSAETFQRIRGKYSFLDWFEDIVLSGEVGAAKPDPRIYIAFLARCACQAETCLFIDDSEANVAAARQLGFNTILYESPEQLRNGLQYWV